MGIITTNKSYALPESINNTFRIQKKSQQESNQIFRILEEWEKVLQGLSKDILPNIFEPKF